MNLNTIYQQCLYICIIIIVFTLALNFISMLWFNTGAVPVKEQYGNKIETDDGNYTKVMQGISLSDISMTDIWTVGMLVSGGLGGFFAVLASTMTRQWQPMAVYLFGMIFWGSFTHSLIFFSEFVPVEIGIGFTVPCIFLFVGGAVAILGGQG